MCRVVQLSSLVSISILLALPHERGLFGGDLEYLWVKRLDDRVADSSLLVDNLLGIGGHLVIEAVACLEVARDVRDLLHHYSRAYIHTLIGYSALKIECETYLAERWFCS